MTRITIARRGAALLAGFFLMTSAGQAQTLTDALIQAYQTSPVLDASRASLRGLDENVAQARAQRRPQVNATASAQGTAWADAEPSTTDQLSAGIQAQLLLFDNGQTRAAIEAARNGIAAARADLRGVEQDVLFSAVQAFMNVRRDLRVVALAANDVAVIEEQLDAVRQQFEVGQTTRTDVSLTEAQLAASRAALVGAQGQLEISREAYRAAVGSPPGQLQAPPSLPELPASLDQSTAIGLRQNPQIVAAQFAERAAVYDFDRARAAGGPTIQAQGGVSYQDQSETLPPPVGGGGRQRDVVGTAGVQASLPLYSGGNRSSLVRQAQTVVEQRRWEVQQAGRGVTQQVAAAWTQLASARAEIGARRQQVEAARLAAEGIAEEARLGVRTQIDVLDANQDLLAAEVNLVQAQTEEYVAGYNLLQAIGLLTVEHLGLGIETYDPDANFRRVQAVPVGGSDRDVIDRIRSRWE